MQFKTNKFNLYSIISGDTVCKLERDNLLYLLFTLNSFF